MPRDLLLSPRRQVGGDAAGRGGHSPSALPTSACPPLSLRDISPRWRGGRGDPPPAERCRAICSSPPAVRWGEMPQAEGGTPPALSRPRRAPLCPYGTSPPAGAGGEGIRGEVRDAAPSSPLPPPSGGGRCRRQRGAPPALCRPRRAPLCPYGTSPPAPAGGEGIGFTPSPPGRGDRNSLSLWERAGVRVRWQSAPADHAMAALRMG